MNIGKCLKQTSLLVRTRGKTKFYWLHNNKRYKTESLDGLPHASHGDGESTAEIVKESYTVDALNLLPRFSAKSSGEVKYISLPSYIHLTALGTGAHGTPMGLVVSTNNIRYFFNCGEDTVRAFPDLGLKLGDTVKLFYTKNSWSNVGGSVGICLQLNNSHIPSIDVYGPPKSHYSLAYTKFDIIGKRFTVDFHGLPEDGIHNSEMSINMIKLFPTSRENLANARMKDMSVAYICKSVLSWAEIREQRFVDNGQQRSPIRYEQLAERISIVSEKSGRKIQLEVPLDDNIRRKCFIVLECPTTHHIDSIVNCRELSSNYWEDDDNYPTNKPKAELSLIVHYTPQEVFETPRYQKWLQSFSEKTEHWVFNENCKGSVLKKAYLLQTRLNLIHPEIFPLLADQQMEKAPHKNVTYAQPGMRFALRDVHIEFQKVLKFDREKCFTVDYDEMKRTAMEVEAFKEALDEVKLKLQHLNDSDIPDKRKYPEVVFLGTSSTASTETRGCSSILVHISPDVCILMDCGGGTISQLYRLYGNQTYSVLAKLKAVYISHLHIDHNLGLTGIIEARKAAMEHLGIPHKPLILIGPSEINYVLRKIGPSSIVRLFGAERLIHHKKDQNLHNFMQEELQLKNIGTCRVYHRQFPYGVSITTEDGFKLVYSGDTLPCDSLVKLGMDCDLLIHEGTFLHTHKDIAYKKRHCTIDQAIEIGIKMNAGFTMVTHFSRRYIFKDLFLDKLLQNRVSYAFDFMKVRPCDLHLLPIVEDAVRVLISENLHKNVTR